MIKFPKAFMRASELVEMGIPAELIARAYGDRNQTFAMKINPAKKNSPLILETAGFAEWMARQIDAQVKGLERT